MAFDSFDSANYPMLPDSVDSSALSQPMRKQGIRKWLLGFLFLFLVVGGGYLAYRQLLLPQQARPRLAPVPVQRTNLSITVSANGTVEPEEVVNVSPKTAGILKGLAVSEGDYVRKGQPIAYMDDSDLQGQLTQAQGQLAAAQAYLAKLLAGNRSEEIAQAQARLNSAQAELRQAEEDLGTNRSLYESGAISRQTYHKTTTARDTAQASLLEAQQALVLSQAGYRSEEIAEARAKVLTAKGSLQSIQTQIEDTIVRAPFDGVINHKYADPGAFVTPMTSGSSVSSATSSSILSLASRNRVVANVSENNISKIKIGQAVVIEADAYPGKQFQGRVTQIATGATVEQNVTSFEVKIAIVSDPQKLLRSGMNVSVEFKAGELKDAITVPTVAVTRQNNVTGVYVGEPNHPPRFVPITTGATVNNRTEVKSGLTGNEHVLVNAPSEPKQQGISIPGLPGSSPSPGDPAGGPPGGGPPPAGGPPGGGGGPGGPPH